jgi:PleD family two-component response regulator
MALSAGNVLSLLKDDDNIETFIKRVDDALYSLKENGRNQVSVL